MKYVLLDTNIIIDMVIDRKRQVKDTLLTSFIRLLDYNEIKLIVPDIVRVETFRHIENELSLVGKQIKRVIDEIDLLYGINTYNVEGLDIKEYKEKSIKEFKKANLMYKKNEELYKKDLQETLDMVFNHKNSIIIACDDFLLNAVTKRRMYKRAPFHREKKESYGDGLITETLINLNRYIELESTDEIYFVTGNYTDFCVGAKDKTTLLPDIMEDINLSGSKCEVKCVDTFCKLICKELKDNVENAKLSEEFEQELTALYEEEMKELTMQIRDMERECVGLTSMKGYYSFLEENLIESRFTDDILQLFDNINEVINSYVYNGYDEFYEELEEMLRISSVSEINNILLKISDVFAQSQELPDISDGIIDEFTSEDIMTVLSWVEEQRRLSELIININDLPDTIEFGDKIKIQNSDFEVFEFYLEKIFLDPEEGGGDCIDMWIRNNCGKVIASGMISITYGYVHQNDDGGITDALADEITYEYSEIRKILKEIHDDWSIFVKEQEAIINMLKDELNV